MDATTAFALLIGLLALGRALDAGKVLPPGTPEALNAVVLHVCLPASVLLFAPRLSLSMELLRVALVPWLLLLIGAIVVLLLARARRWSQPTTAVLLLAVGLGNTSFLGYPLVASLAGDDALAWAVVYDQLGSFLILSTVGLLVIARCAHGQPPGWRDMLARVLRFPPFIALLLAITLMPATYPAPIEAILQRLSEILLPLVAIALGMQMRLRLPRAQLAPLLTGLLLKLLLLPLCAWLLLEPLGIRGAARDAVVLEAAMPTMITAMALASAARLAPELGAALVGYSTVLAVVTVPLWYVLMN